MKERLLNSFPGRVVRRYASANGSAWGIDIAWNLLFAFFPIILVTTTFVGILIGDGGAATDIDRNLETQLPAGQGALVVQALRSFHNAAGPLLVVSLAGLVWSGSSLFGAMDQGLSALHAAKPRSFVRQKLMAIVMMLVLTVLVVLATASSSLLSLVTSVRGAPAFLSVAAVAYLLQVAFGVAVGILLFGAIYVVVPNVRQRVGEIFYGAALAAVLFEAFTLLFPLYFKLEHGFSTYGSTFALFFLLLTFAYWIGQIIMFGGAVNVERRALLRERIPETAAPTSELSAPDDGTSLVGVASPARGESSARAPREAGKARVPRVLGDGWGLPPPGSSKERALAGWPIENIGAQE